MISKKLAHFRDEPLLAELFGVLPDVNGRECYPRIVFNCTA